MSKLREHVGVEHDTENSLLIASQLMSICCARSCSILPKGHLCMIVTLFGKVRNKLSKNTKVSE